MILDLKIRMWWLRLKCPHQRTFKFFVGDDDGEVTIEGCCKCGDVWCKEVSK